MQVVQQNQNKQLHNTQRQAEEVARNASQSITECVKEYPLSSVAVVVGAGIGIGYLASLMISSRRDEEYASFTRRMGEKMLAGVESIVPHNWMERLSK